jgi:hypothetical protein
MLKPWRHFIACYWLRTDEDATHHFRRRASGWGGERWYRGGAVTGKSLRLFLLVDNDKIKPCRTNRCFACRLSHRIAAMIYESYYWKSNLDKLATKLRKYSRRKNPGEALLAHFEQTVMLGFYSIRKLAESQKLSDNVASQQIELTAYAWNGQKNVTVKNWDNIDKLYDMIPQSVSRDVIFVCNQIIHSYVFLPVFSEARGCIISLWFSSDRHRHQFLYQIQLEQVIELFRQVAKDYPNCGSWTFNPATKDYDCTQWVGGYDEDNQPVITAK